MKAKAGEFYLTYEELKEIGIIRPTSVFILSNLKYEKWKTC
jgi:hypothetical protein